MNFSKRYFVIISIFIKMTEATTSKLIEVFLKSVIIIFSAVVMIGNCLPC